MRPLGGKDRIRELERLLARLRYAKAGQTHYDMWEHYGAGTAGDEQRATMNADLAECNRIYSEAKSALEALVSTLRAESSPDLQTWVDAHDAYLAWVIARGDAESTNVDTARRERNEWAKVRSGALAFVDESVHAPEGKQRYHELFGFEPID